MTEWKFCGEYSNGLQIYFRKTDDKGNVAYKMVLDGKQVGTVETLPIELVNLIADNISKLD